MIFYNLLTKKNIVIALFLSLVLVACSKDSVVTPDPAPQPGGTKKLAKIEYDGGSYQSMTYNSNGTINTITVHIAYSQGTPDHIVYNMFYSGGLATELRGSDGSKFKYLYVNQQLVKTEVYAAGNLVAFYEYTYANGKLVRTDGYHRLPGGTVSSTPTMRYGQEYYANGNLKKMSLYYRNTNTGVLEKSNDYLIDQYDTQPNTSAIFENNPFMPLESLIPNNPLSELHYDMNGALEETVIHTYTYDNDGAPLTRKTTTKTSGFPDQVENARFYY